MAATAGSSKMWTIEETYRLIESFENNPALWSKDNKEYKNKPFRGIILEQLAAEFKTNTEAIKEKLRSLRTIFGQNLKRLVKNDTTPRWEYFGALSFLKPDMLCEQNEIISDQSTYANEDSNVFIGEHQFDDVSIHRDVVEPVIYCKKMRTNSPSPSSQERDRQSYAIQPDFQPLRSTTSNRHFGDYVTLSLDLMNNSLVEEKVKLEIQLLLSQAISETASNSHERLSTASHLSDVRFEHKWRPSNRQGINNSETME